MVAATLANKIVLSRTKVSVTANIDIYMTLQGPLSGTLTVTFPVGFTVTAAATGGTGCFSGFGFTSSTLTATKTNCSGAIAMTGATVINPSTIGTYRITWVNDDPGGGSVFITDEDQANVNALISSTITFNVGAQAAATPCDGTFSGSGGTVALGVLSPSSVSSSDSASVAHVCSRITSDASFGVAVSVRSANGNLRSASVPTATIASGTATLVAGTVGYGLCAGSAGADSGNDTTIPVSSSPARTSPFNGSCTSSAHAVGALTTSAQNVWRRPALRRTFSCACTSKRRSARRPKRITITAIP